MSKSTKNHKLFKYEDNDNADLTFLGNTMDIIDGGLSPFYVATLDSANIYKVITGLSLTELKDGFSVRIAIPSTSTGASSLIIDEVGAIPIKKVNGNAVTNLKANGVYSLTYYNGNFILASGGVDSDKVTASEPDVLNGKTFIGTDEEIHTGTMTDNGAVNVQIGINGSYTIPKGYHNGQGKVTQSVPDRGEYQYTGGVGGGTDYLSFNQIPYGYYPQSSNGWAPEIRAKLSDIASHLGITADKIVSGNNICGLNGTATIQSLGGLKIKAGQLGVGQSTTTDFTIKRVILYARSAGKYYNSSSGTSYTTLTTEQNSYNYIDFEVGCCLSIGSAIKVADGSSASNASVKSLNGATTYDGTLYSVSQNKISISSNNDYMGCPWYLWRTNWNYIAMG